MASPMREELEWDIHQMKYAKPYSKMPDQLGCQLAYNVIRGFTPSARLRLKPRINASPYETSSATQPASR
jgi:hypothetical protein